MARRLLVIAILSAVAATAPKNGECRDNGRDVAGPDPAIMHRSQDRIVAAPLFALGGEFGAPLRLAGSLHADLALSRASSSDMYLLQGVGSVGLGGAKAGFGAGYAGDGGFWSLRAVLAQTFQNPMGALPNRTWAGVEAEWSFVHLLSAQVGVLQSRDGRQDTAFTWSVGVALPLVNWGDVACGMNPGACH